LDDEQQRLVTHMVIDELVENAIVELKKERERTTANLEEKCKRKTASYM